MKEIVLTQGQVALVDDSDFAMLSHFKWHALKHDGGFYARTRIGTSMQYMHRVIMTPENPFMVDHIDGNKLNNQRSNLRIVTAAQNCRNRIKRIASFCKYKGINKFPRSNRYRAVITVNGKIIKLGWFGNQIDAAKAYDKAAIKYFGEYAKLNFGGAL